MASDFLPEADPEFQTFKPRFPWWGGDLQTLRNYLTRGGWDLSPWPSERLYFEVGDGSGDRLQAVLHRREGAAVAVLVHGLTGCEESFYVLETARFMLSKGFSVLRMNLRGAGPSRKTCTGHYYAGSSAELDAVLRQLPNDLIAPGLVLVGYSLGGNVVLKYLAERPLGVAPDCAITISAPIDLAAASRRMMEGRNRLYHHWLLKRMAAEAGSGGARLSPDEKAAIRGARTVFEFDDRFVAPRNGFDGAGDYYDRCSSAGMLPAIDTPVLLLHARNDPWIPADAYDQFAQSGASPVSVMLSDSGGHVGFHGADIETPWQNACINTYSTRHISSP
jgi:uncharacterized protein